MHNKNISKRTKRIRVGIVAALLAAAIAGGLIAQPKTVMAQSSYDLQQQINELESQQSALEQRQAEAAEQLSQLENERDNQLAIKQALDDQMTSIGEQIEVINTKVKTLNKKINSLKKEMEAHQTKVDDTFNQLKGRIRALYLAGEASDLEIILNAHSIADLSEKLTVVQSVSEHDNEIIQTLKTELSEIKTQKEEYQQAREQVAKEKNKLEQKQEEVMALVQESEAIMAELNSNIDEKNSLAAQLDEEFNNTANEITNKIKQYNAAKSAEEKAAEKEAAKNVVTVDDDNYNSSYTAPAVDDDDNDYKEENTSTAKPSKPASSTGNGQFIWPTPGATMITSGVGPRWGTTHCGIDISGGSCYGTPIIASDSGRVIVANHSGWGGGYGLYVVIDHGNGYTTLYGHQSSVIVNEGDVVSQGQTIGYIGSTGDSTGPHLHFEVRYNGAIQDPENYVGSGG